MTTTAAEVVAALEAERSNAELAKVRKRLAPGEPAIGLRMGTLFAIATAHSTLDLGEVERLVDHEAYEPRLAAFCILDFRARRRLSDDERRLRYELYLRRHDSITAWDMVDRSAPRVVGAYLAGRSLAPLHQLAAAPDPLRRRTAITAPLLYAFGDHPAELTECFTIAAALATDPEPVVHNAVGIFLKHAGGRDPDALERFLVEHGPSMPRPALRLAIEKLAPADRARHLGR